jgi:hypothetical protein
VLRRPHDDVRWIDLPEISNVFDLVPPNQLHKRLRGAKVTYFFLISGVAAHDVYHAGQIQLLKRLQKNACTPA